MQNGLNISFVTKDEFTSLKGVKPESLEIDPGNIEDPNLVRAYKAEHSVIKSKANGDVDNPIYTTRAQACTAGFLRVRVGMEPQSHMMLHLLGIKKDDLNPVEQAAQDLPKKLDEFFGSLDDLIRLAIERYEKIYIDHVAIGSIEQSVGELPGGAQCEPLSAIKANSGDLRRFIEESVNSKVDEIKERAKESGVEVDFSESSFTGQTSIFTGEHPEIPMSHMHYDPSTQTLSINADYYTQIIGASEIHGLNITDAEAISRHYAKVLLGGNHTLLNSTKDHLVKVLAQNSSTASIGTVLSTPKAEIARDLFQILYNGVSTKRIAIFGNEISTGTNVFGGQYYTQTIDGVVYTYYPAQDRFTALVVNSTEGTRLDKNTFIGMIQERTRVENDFKEILGSGGIVELDLSNLPYDSDQQTILNKLIQVASWSTSIVRSSEGHSDNVGYAVKEVLKNAYVHGNKGDKSIPIFIHYDSATRSLEIINYNNVGLHALRRNWCGENVGLSISGIYANVSLNVGHPGEMTIVRINPKND